jgi:hypothetical protein
MLQDIVAVSSLGGYRLLLRFEDGVEGIVDLGPHLKFRGVFEPLLDEAFFARVRVDSDLGTVVWPNGADLDPDVLYSRVTGTPIKQELDVPPDWATPAKNPPAGLEAIALQQEGESRRSGACRNE